MTRGLVRATMTCASARSHRGHGLDATTHATAAHTRAFRMMLMLPSRKSRRAEGLAFRDGQRTPPLDPLRAENTSGSVPLIRNTEPTRQFLHPRSDHQVIALAGTGECSPAS